MSQSGSQCSNEDMDADPTLEFSGESEELGESGESSTEQAQTHGQQEQPSCILPPTLRPYFEKEITMMYNIGSGQSQVLQYGVERNPKTITKREYCRIKNLRRRDRPYDRQLERKQCASYEKRQNDLMERAMGKRFLKSGSVCMLYVLNDDRKAVLSNPPQINQLISTELHNKVLQEMAPFLASNPINRVCPDNPYFHQWNRIPVETVSVSRFVSSAISSFKHNINTTISLLSLYATVQRLHPLAHLFILNVLLQKHICKLKAAAVETWTNSQSVAFLTHLIVLYPDYLLNEVTETIHNDHQKKWKRVVEQARKWKMLHLLDGHIPEVTFHPNMVEEGDVGSDDSDDDDAEDEQNTEDDDRNEDSDTDSHDDSEN
jgi:hypothetical protein